MANTINLGNIFSSGSRTVVSGLGSGLDTKSIVESLVAVRQASVDAVQKKIDGNTGKVTAYGELETLLTSLKSAVDILRNPPGVFNAAQNGFLFRSASVDSNTSVSGDTYLSVTAEPGADIGDFDLKIDAIAKAKSEMTSVGFTDRTSSIVEAAAGVTAGMFSAGTITLNALGTNVDIDLEAGDSLNDVVQKINSQKSDSGVQASILKFADNDYRMVLTSVNTGTAYAYTLTDDGSGVFAEVGFSSVETEANASLTVNGVAGITRSSNSINDLFDDVTLNLKAPTPVATELAVSIEADTEIAKSAILSFVDAYNNLKLFLSKQTQRDSSGQPLDTASLANESSLRTIGSQVGNELSTLVAGLAQNFNDLSDVGITFSNFQGDTDNPATRNILVVDTDKLDSALATNYDDLRKIFEFDLTSDSTDLLVYKRTNDLALTEFTLDVNTVAKTATASFDDGNGGTTTINLDYDDSSGTVILSGQEDTELEGLELIYTGSGTESIDVTVSQGIADRLFNYLDSTLSEDNGLVQTEVNALTDQNEGYQTKIEQLNVEIEEFRLQLLEKFSRLEDTIAQVNTLLQSLAASDLARNSSNN